MRYRGKIGIILAAVGFGLLLSGCIAGGILGKTYVPWLSNFVDRETAYRVCMQEETNATVLVDIVDRWYALDDIMAYDDIATNPQHDMHQQPMCRIKQKDEIKNQRGNLHRLHYHPHLQPSVSGQFPSE